MTDILNYKEPMEYRRFGKTDCHVSVITLGGMRYINGWEEPKDDVPAATRENCIACVNKAFECGINHIETAYGYGKSEHCYGIVLNDELKVPRDSYYLMTKGAPASPEEARKMVAEQLDALKTDYIDFYGWHGLNNNERYDMAVSSGAVEELLKMKQEGIIRHVGFSTHGSCEAIIKNIETDLFDFINLHYYYFYQRNQAAVDFAASKDMGVFIISPNDKGGKLYSPSNKLKELTMPLTPIQWNARFCLKTDKVQTLTFGMNDIPHFDEMMGIFNTPCTWPEQDQDIQNRIEEQLKQDPYSWYDGYDMLNDPSGINIPEVLRFRRLWKCYDMTEYGEYRYNMFKEGCNWFPGAFPTDDNLDKVDYSKVSEGVPLRELLSETHKRLYKEPK